MFFIHYISYKKNKKLIYRISIKMFFIIRASIVYLESKVKQKH